MVDISVLDKNLAVSNSIAPEIKAEFDFYDIDSNPFAICGVFREGDHYVRIPDAVAQTVSEPVSHLNQYTSGGRIRFVTDSKRIAIHAVCYNRLPSPHMAFTGTSGFDIYAHTNDNWQYFGSYKPPVDCEGVYEGVVSLPLEGKHTLQVNMPLYNGVYKVYIGIEKGAALEAAAPLLQPPVVYYGSSITQGACASRPGNCYQAMLHRHFMTDYLNLGFSGNARAEVEIMEYIAGLDMSMFVYDYDHNAPNVAHLQATHERGYRIIREKHPELPILMMSRPKYHLSPTELERNAIIRATYEKALAEGDKHVYYIDGRDLLLPYAREHSLVDGAHPSDVGFLGMYARMLPLMETLVK